MFKSITALHLPSLGQLAEMILFYRNTRVFFDERSLRGLFSVIHPATLIPFFEDHKESIEFHWITAKVWGQQFRDNDYIDFMLSDEEYQGVDEPYLDYLERTNILDTPDGYITDKQLVNRLLELITTDEASFTWRSATDFGDEIYSEIQSAAKPVVDMYVDLFSGDLNDSDDPFDLDTYRKDMGAFEVQDKSEALKHFTSFYTQYVESDIATRYWLTTEEFKAEVLTFIREYTNKFPNSEFLLIPKDLDIEVTFDSVKVRLRIHTKRRLSERRRQFIYGLLHSYLSNMSELPIWTKWSSEILVPETSSFVIRHKINSLLNAQTQSRSAIEHFQEVSVNEAKALREVIDNDPELFLDFIKIYERSYKFKDWIHELPSDANLLREYYSTVTSSSWFDRMPNKIARWFLFTGLGLGIDALGAGGAGTLLGITLGAFDTFLVDKLVEGWTPNQFIDKELRPFLVNGQAKKAS